MQNRNREYDAFGPWIYPIDEKDEIPSIFASYFYDQQTPLLLLKIPRNIERRSATPGLPLYDYVVGAYSDFLYVLKREGDHVNERRIAYQDIQAIKITQELLRGRVDYYLPDGPFIIPFNTVSDDIILKLNQIIRSQMLWPENTVFQMQTLSGDLAFMDFLLFNLVRGIQSRDNSARLVAYQTPIQIKNPKIVNRVISAFFSFYITHGSAFLTNGKELILLEKGRPLSTYCHCSSRIRKLRISYLLVK